MSTMDYLEFKNHLEHSFTQRDKAKEYEKRGKEEANLREREWKDRIRANAIKLIDTYLNANNTTSNTYVHNTGANYYSTHGGNQTVVTELGKANRRASKKEDEALDNLLSFINKYPEAFSNSSEERYIKWLSDKKTFNKQEFAKDLKESLQTIHYSWRRSSASHSNLEHASKAGMPTNLKQESSNIKRASERAKFMNQMQQVCNKIRVKYGQLTNLQDANFDTYNDPVRGNGRKTGGGYTGGEEINKLRWKYSKETNPLVKQLHNLLNAGKNSPLFTDAEKEKMRKWMQEGGTLGELATVYSDIFGSVSHDNLEHGWFTDLFKKSYNAKGSTAGMPTNLPRTATSGGSAGSKQLVYSDQLRKLNNNLVEYELKMNQAKASYEEYRKLYNDTKKNIANTEKALTEATKEAARTGFDPSKSSVAAPARRYASSNAILPQTTITGSTEGLKKTRYHVKKKK